MALETFKAQLKAKAKTLGVTNLSNKRIDAYAATLEKQNPNLSTDDDHAEKIDALLELVDLKEVAAMDDRNRSKAGKEGKTDDKKDDTKGKEDEKPDTPADDTSVPAWAKALIESNKALTETVGKLQAEKTQASMQTRLKESLKDIPASFYDEWALPQKEEELEAFQEKVKTKWEAFTKDNPVQTGGSAGAGGHKPNRGGGPQDAKATKEEVESIVNGIM